MTATRLDGKALSLEIREHLAQRVEGLRQNGRRVRLDAVLAPCRGDSAARVYAESQGRMCAKAGIEYELHELSEECEFDEIGGRILLLNNDESVHAIMVHMPLPEKIDTYAIQKLIAPEKDVEGVNPANIGNIVYGRSSLAPCTALAAMRLIKESGVSLRGATCAVVGASDIVGKPIAAMLMREEATVISCNEFTEDITGYTSRADVLVAAAGVPGLVKRDWVKPGAVVIDVGINRVKGPDGGMVTVGDVAFDEVCEVAGAITPVPGGVGPMTVAMLLHNVVSSAEPRMAGKPRYRSVSE
ncbi:MAG: bifunctional 5,10-methylenetetrahydrofolate dehydrogenase/5,10-methenyltetrahydrofolate cyclohydrolase [Phycisphaerales bacterium]